MISIIDYGAGNLHSVQNALNFLGAENFVSDDVTVVIGASKDEVKVQLRIQPVDSMENTVPSK